MDHAAPGTAAWSHAMAGLTARRAPARATGAGARQYTLGAGRVRGPVGVAASRTGSPRRRGRVETRVARFLDLYLWYQTPPTTHRKIMHTHFTSAHLLPPLHFLQSNQIVTAKG